MRVRQIIDEDFVNYKEPSMFIVFSTCTWKCEKECGIKGMCQNTQLAKTTEIDYDDDQLIQRYLDNQITKAIVLGGLEPFDRFDVNKFGSEVGTQYGQGFYFTTYKNLARDYGHQVKTVYLNITQPFNMNDAGYQTLKQCVNLSGCTDYDENMLKKYEKYEYIASFILTLQDVLGYKNRKIAYKSFMKYIEVNNYDGVTHNFGAWDSEIVALYPNQIKSIKNKNQTESDNINEQYDI